jgi:hypothetical protein
MVTRLLGLAWFARRWDGRMNGAAAAAEAAPFRNERRDDRMVPFLDV